jgi:LysM repeat protein
LLAVTVAIVLIRAGMNAGSKGAETATPPARRHVTTTTAGRTHKPPAGRRFYTVQAGDTFSVISRKTGVAVATIARLNPKASSTSLHIGEKLRIK